LLDSHQRSLFSFYFLSPLPRTPIPGRVVPVLTTVMGDLHANGIVFGEDRPCGSSPPSPPLPISNPDPSSVAADAWAAAEQTTGEILRSIQPTLAADRRRREVVDYVQRLIRYGARCEVMLLALVDSHQYSIMLGVTGVVLVAWMFGFFFFLYWIQLNDLGVLVRYLCFCLYGFGDCEGVGLEFGLICVVLRALLLKLGRH